MADPNNPNIAGTPNPNLTPTPTPDPTSNPPATATAAETGELVYTVRPITYSGKEYVAGRTLRIAETDEVDRLVKLGYIVRGNGSDVRQGTPFRTGPDGRKILTGVPRPDGATFVDATDTSNPNAGK